MKIRLTIVSFFISLASLAQMSIENIQTDKDVIQFVFEYGQKYNKGWQKVRFNDVSQMFPKYITKKKDLAFLDSLTRIKWIRSDFNEDGKLDLIFSGRVYTQLVLLAFMSKRDSIECDYLGSNVALYYPSGIKELNIDGLKLLSISSFVRSDIQYEIRNSYKTDTLVYKFGGFAELNSQNKFQLGFDSIAYNVSSPWMGLVHVPLMKVYNNGSVILYRNKYTYNKDSALWQNGVHESIVDKEVIDNLIGILNYINFDQLGADYAINLVSDLATSTTRVYINGKEKKIKDYGGHGTYGLSLLYKKLNEIKLRGLPKPVQ